MLDRPEAPTNWVIFCGLNPHALTKEKYENRRRQDLLVLLDRLDPTIAELSQAIEQEVEK